MDAVNFEDLTNKGGETEDLTSMSSSERITKLPEPLENYGDHHVADGNITAEAVFIDLPNMEKSASTAELKCTSEASRNQENRSFKCDHCGSVFRQKNNLRRHLKLHSEYKPYVCKECGFAFHIQDSLKKHMRTHTGEKPYKCEECNSCFAHSGHLKAHKRTHSGEKPYMCQDCGLFFSQAGNLKVHMRIHTGEKPFVCKICGAAFAISSVFKKHKLVHTGERPFKCSYCDARFSSNSNLSRHNKTHTGERPFKCHLCDATFPVKNSLDRHIKSHTGERPYCCEMCGAVFANMSDLTKHRKTHSSEKPLKCNICEKGFFSKSQMNIHIRTHTGEKPHKCELCDAAFAQIGTLNKHKQRHSGKKPFRCDICGTQFTAKSSLKKHMERHASNASESPSDNCNMSTYCDVNVENPPFQDIQNKIINSNGTCSQESLSTKILTGSPQTDDTLNITGITLNGNNQVMDKHMIHGSNPSHLPSVSSSLHNVDSAFIAEVTDTYASELHTMSGQMSESNAIINSYTSLDERSTPVSFPTLQNTSELCDIGKNPTIVDTAVHNEVQYIQSFSDVTPVPSIQPVVTTNSVVPSLAPPQKW